MKRTTIVIALLSGIMTLSTASAQTSFSIMTLNVDGLPGKLLFFDVNKDGPLSAGSERISEYIAAKGCDIVAMQECFNYRWEIWSRLFAGYEHDEWTGGIENETNDIDYFHLQNHRFPCDGLNNAWKKNVTSTAYERVPHKKSFGKFSHDFDDIITKGFRRHEYTLADGTEIVVYNTHFDASSERDEKLGNDSLDRAARLSQWIQLRDHMMERLDSRPVLLTGDFNSYYHRDSIVAHFIEPIEATGRATVGDVWIEKCREGVYPLIGDDADADEQLDKILYVNPVEGKVLKPVSVEVDAAAYQYEGKALGDHFPLIANFQVTDRKLNNIDAPEYSKTSETYDLQGRRTERKTKGVYISDGRKYIAE